MSNNTSEPSQSIQHRTWEDWLALLAGVVIMLAPWIPDETVSTASIVNAAIAGVAVLMLAEFDIVHLRRWTVLGQIACGVWVALSPVIFGYAGSGTLRIWHVVAGLVVAALGALELKQFRADASA